MEFSFSLNSTILFSAWRTSGLLSMIFSCCIIFALGFGKEFLVAFIAKQNRILDSQRHRDRYNTERANLL
jgi:hypothetical protein